MVDSPLRTKQGDSLFGGPSVCSACGTPTWLAEHCHGAHAVGAVVHFARESSARPGSWHLICRAPMRGDDFKTSYPPEANCPTCMAILEREARAAA